MPMNEKIMTLDDILEMQAADCDPVWWRRYRVRMQ